MSDNLKFKQDNIDIEKELLPLLENLGIYRKDPRISDIFKKLKQEEQKQITKKELSKLVDENHFLHRCLSGDLVIPEWKEFTDKILDIYLQTQTNTSGNLANYIPQLARVDPEQYQVSICSIDGQQFSYGNAPKTAFCLQSTTKPINYCIASDELGEELVHKHVGREPSGRSFNEMALNQDGLPHNPMINSGAIMCTSLIKKQLDIADRFDYIMNQWTALTGGKRPNFNNAVYLSERQTADRNFALAYFMRENNAFPEKTNLIETLELYFQCCSIELNTRDTAIVAATLANGGRNPLSGKKIFSSQTTKNCLSLMNSCGMYDFSGEFSFKIGLPAKSGVSGVIYLVVPNVMGICIWSPRLDKHGNSVRGVDFCKKFSELFNFHSFDSLFFSNKKSNPRKTKFESEFQKTVNLIWAASKGDLIEIKKLEAQGIDLKSSDYDGRTALHLASAEGHLEIVEYLINKNVTINCIDRFGMTPLKEAKKGKFKEIENLLNTSLKNTNK